MTRIPIHCEHEWEEHCVTEVNGAGVQREYWQECIHCHETVSDEGIPIEHPRADCEGCGDPTCVCHSNDADRRELA